MALVRIGDAGDFLQFEVAERGPHIDPTDDDFSDMQAELRLGDLTARPPVTPHFAAGFRDLVAFFDGLERDWRGWSGVRNGSRWDTN